MNLKSVVFVSGVLALVACSAGEPTAPEQTTGGLSEQATAECNTASSNYPTTYLDKVDAQRCARCLDWAEVEARKECVARHGGENCQIDPVQAITCSSTFPGIFQTTSCRVRYCPKQQSPLPKNIALVDNPVDAEERPTAGSTYQLFAVSVTGLRIRTLATTSEKKQFLLRLQPVGDEKHAIDLGYGEAVRQGDEYVLAAQTRPILLSGHELLHAQVVAREIVNDGYPELPEAVVNFSRGSVPTEGDDSLVSPPARARFGQFTAASLHVRFISSQRG